MGLNNKCTVGHGCVPVHFSGNCKMHLKRLLGSSTGLFLACLSLILGGCAGGGQVVSSGAALPQAANAFSDGPLKVTVSHNCDGARCTTLTARFENTSASPLEIVPSTSRLVRAGQAYVLGRVGDQKGNLAVAPHDAVSAEFQPLGEGGKQPMSYVVPKKVYCSMDVDPACKNYSPGAARCAGFARYYYDTYASTGGWIALNFAYRTEGRNEFISSPTPEFLGTPPPVRLTEDEAAPRFGANPDDVVFLKMQCNAQCRCSEITKARNFFLDDKLLPVFKK